MSEVGKHLARGIWVRAAPSAEASGGDDRFARAVGFAPPGDDERARAKSPPTAKTIDDVVDPAHRPGDLPVQAIAIRRRRVDEPLDFDLTARDTLLTLCRWQRSTQAGADGRTQMKPPSDRSASSARAAPAAIAGRWRRWNASERKHGRFRGSGAMIPIGLRPRRAGFSVRRPQMAFPRRRRRPLPLTSIAPSARGAFARAPRTPAADGVA